MNEKYVGNITTIVKTVSMIFAGWIIGALAAYGLDLHLTQIELTSIISAILFSIIAYLDAKYPNTFIDKNGVAETTVMVNLDPNELSEAINEAKENETLNEVEADDRQ